MRAAVGLGAIVIVLATLSAFGQGRHTNEIEGYLTWTAAHAEKVGRSSRVNGRVGGAFDLRMLHTDRSYNYKLRATWLTPEVIRATARLAQLADLLSNAETDGLVKQAEAVGDTVILVEIDPREGSGVIPLDWSAYLGPSGVPLKEAAFARGRNLPGMRDTRALQGVFRRDYNYEMFWVAFPLRSESGAPLFDSSVSEAELVVRIYNKEGRVKWPVPEYLRRVGR